VVHKPRWGWLLRPNSERRVLLAGCSGASEDTQSAEGDVPSEETVETSESALASAPACISRTVKRAWDGTIEVKIGNNCTYKSKGYTAAVYVDVGAGPDSACLYVPYSRDQSQKVTYNISLGKYNAVRSCLCNNGQCGKP
jgi:hypothetical protein